MEYLDLSPYTYYKFPLGMRNIGWLGGTHGLQSADAPAMTNADLERLRATSRNLSSVMLGRHQCEWCPSHTASEGNGEYHYYAPDGEVYAAPAMIVHYVEEHGYRPPEVFLESLRVTEELAWDWRAERLATVLLDESEDLAFRALTIADLAHWKHPHALDALLRAARDQELADVAGDQIGWALGPFLSCDFAPDLRVEDFPDMVRYGIDEVRRRR
ncbi:hypothetical protein KZZ52_01550 [Dactylosporangium sp. AC04546]|uniref:DUF7919 family protein n=1 Tax=Dactylosporangium sp. AC04546 TaxID=2862460 RepID=UPI001EDE425C|nr:hypothetical protein [Dactylosporangium sp. AC04546]WVK84150.1 hypothetical protein KZZ52_01550 [Dactylosporangium sp. AC04546]